MMNREFKAEEYKSKKEIKVRYDDLDTLGHVNNKTYLSYLEESRIQYMTDVLGFKKESLDFDVVVGRIDISYFSPLHLNDTVFVYTGISRIGEKSFDFQCYITKTLNEKDVPAAYAVVTMVSVDQKTGKTKPNEQEMVKAVLAFETIKPEFNTNQK
ncbi:MAG: acyl-CoA thioesterase [Bacteroidetes bacterium]|nr:MAG: acyl-CoA thioesterase [Bacteroidota bacterium]